jgi:hypothetical protein
MHHFTKKRSFCQDRLGTNIGKTQKKSGGVSHRDEPMRKACNELKAPPAVNGCNIAPAPLDGLDACACSVQHLYQYLSDLNWVVAPF